MKVFISWSGVASRKVAEALSEWLPKVIQGVKPFVSAKDLDKGSNWTVELAAELSDTDFGIVCLAPDNLVSPWLNYEAGAITKSVDSRVAPVLFHVSKEQVGPPLAQLQLTSIEIEEFELLMISINKSAGNHLREDQVKEAVAVWWPSLVKAINDIEVPEAVSPDANPKQAEPAQPEADLTEMIGDVLHQLRTLDVRTKRMEQFFEARPPREGATGRDRLTSQLIARELARNKIRPLHVKIEDDRIRVKLSEIPEGLDLSDLLDWGAKLAMREDRELWIESPERTFTFDQDGGMSEIPF